MNAFAIFQKAQQTLSKNPKDENAQFTVDLWNASKNLNDKNVSLRAEVDGLKAELAAANKSNADYARNQDMLESKLGRAPSDGGKSFDAGNWLAAQFSVAGISAR
jgi:uncharacterized protein YlxW (UPF0749 family)